MNINKSIKQTLNQALLDYMNAVIEYQFKPSRVTFRIADRTQKVAVAMTRAWRVYYETRWNHPDNHYTVAEANDYNVFDSLMRREDDKAWMHLEKGNVALPNAGMEEFRFVMVEKESGIMYFMNGMHYFHTRIQQEMDVHKYNIIAAHPVVGPVRMACTNGLINKE